jgi:SprT-like family protein
MVSLPLITPRSVPPGIMTREFKAKWSDAQKELQALFAVLDQQHYGGRLGVAGYRVQIMRLKPGRLGQCSSLPFEQLIQIDPEQAQPPVGLRTVLLHEMAHAACDLENPFEPEHGPKWRREAHGSRWRREIIRCIKAERRPSA